MKVLFSILVLCLSITAVAQRRKPIISAIPAYSADRLLARVANRDTTYIVNFWATWCPRCVRELPTFDTLQKRYAGTAVKVLMVSLDIPSDVKTKLALFAKSNVSAEVLWLAEKDMETVMPKIDKTWTGMLPATLILSGFPRTRVFMPWMVTAAEVIDKIPVVAAKL